MNIFPVGVRFLMIEAMSVNAWPSGPHQNTCQPIVSAQNKIHLNQKYKFFRNDILGRVVNKGFFFVSCWTDGAVTVAMEV